MLIGSTNEHQADCQPSNGAPIVKAVLVGCGNKFPTIKYRATITEIIFACWFNMSLLVHILIDLIHILLEGVYYCLLVNHSNNGLSQYEHLTSIIY